MRIILRVSKKNKLRVKLDNFASDKNWTLTDAELVLAQYGFVREEGRGSHINFKHPALNDVFTLVCHGTQMKPAYIRMIRQAINDLPK